MNRWLLVAGLLGATAIALGAWAAHGLPAALSDLGHAEETHGRRIENFLTGTRYQLGAALACLAVGAGSLRTPRSLGVAAALIAGGAVVFSGLLYAIALGPATVRWLGAIVPLGGLGMIAGWVMIAVAGIFASRREETRLQAELVRLEELLTHQQRLWQDLDEVVTGLRDSGDSREVRIARLEDAARQLLDAHRSSEPLPDERPPHY